MGLVFQPPLTRQPQTTPRINRSNRLGARVLSAHLRGRSLLVPGAMSVASGAFALGADDDGLMTSFDGASHLDFHSTVFRDITRPITLAYLFKARSAILYTGVARITGTTGSNTFCILRSTDAAYRYAIGYTSTGFLPVFTAVPTLTAQVRERTLVTCAGGMQSVAPADYVPYINRVQYTSSIDFFFTSQTADTSYLGWDGIDSKLDGLLDEFVIFDGVLSPGEISAYYDNPHQIYAPFARRLWAPADVVAPLVATRAQFDARMTLSHWW